jgi:hypothetical protein
MQICYQAAHTASQTASQSVQLPAIIWVQPRTSLTPAAALPCVPEITDTEEVTGSNPVSPTSITPGQTHFPTVTALLHVAALLVNCCSDRGPVNARHLGIWPLSARYQIQPFSRAIRYASARDPASSFWVIVAR